MFYLHITRESTGLTRVDMEFYISGCYMEVGNVGKENLLSATMGRRAEAANHLT